MKTTILLFTAALVLTTFPLRLAAQCLVFNQEHVDLLAVQYDAASNTLSLMASDDEHGALYSSDECIVRCPESMKFSLPAGTPLGDEGDPMWILPQNPYEGAPYIGVSAETLAPGSFQDPINVQLLQLEGPGHLLLWQATGFGSLDVKIDSRDGIDATDRITPFVGAHEHYNWGFTASGVYRAYFQASGRRPDQTTNLVSAITPYTFHVLPLSPFEVWTTTNWPCEIRPEIISPEADPDSDGAPNAFEYGVGTDPKTPNTEPWLTLSFAADSGTAHCLLTFARSKTAIQAALTIMAADEVGQPQWREISALRDTADLGDRERITLEDVLPVNPASPRFYRLQVTLHQ